MLKLQSQPTLKAGPEPLSEDEKCEIVLDRRSGAQKVWVGSSSQSPDSLLAVFHLHLSNES